MQGARPLAASARSAYVQPAAMAHCVAADAPSTAVVVVVEPSAVVLKPSPQKLQALVSLPVAQ